MSGIEILLIIVIVTLTMLLLVVGLQVLLILWSIRKLIERVTMMVDGRERLSEIKMPEPLKKLLGFLLKRRQ